MEERQTVLFRFHDKERPSIILSIEPDNAYAIIIVGSTVCKPHKLPVRVDADSRAGRQMHLHYDTYFYDDKVMLVPVAALYPLSVTTTCPRDVFRALQNFAIDREFDPRHKNTRSRPPPKKKGLFVTLGDLLKHRG